MAAGSVGLWVRLEAQPGRAADLAAFLRSAQPPPDATSWFSIQLGPTAFGIFDAFADDDDDDGGRPARPDREIANALTTRADELRSEAPGVERVDVLASKLP